jgi:hypothetical protein
MEHPLTIDDFSLLGDLMARLGATILIPGATEKDPA